MVGRRNEEEVLEEDEEKREDSGMAGWVASDSIFTY